MTVQEFSNEFDVLYNNITSNQAPGLDEYEKSVFLTKAQDEIIKNYFNTKSNIKQEGFDATEKRQYDFSTLLRVASLHNINYAKERLTALEKIDNRSQVFIFPKDYFLSVNEIISDGITQFSVIPLQYKEYQREMLKPYAYPVKKGVWRIFSDKKNCNFYQEYVNNTNCDYRILTTWADQKRNISLTIKVENFTDSSTYIEKYGAETSKITGTHEIFCGSIGSKLYADSSWSDDSLTYNITLTLYYAINTEDEEVLDKIKFCFAELKRLNGNIGDIYKAAVRLDYLIDAEAPSQFYQFTDGKTMIFEVIQLPIAEVIGRFNGDITYQIRYVKRPAPIILADFSNTEVSINGVSKVTECELSEECHSEILQRAVELAKAAYTGDLKSITELGQRSE